jgi:hypothetical protein
MIILYHALEIKVKKISTSLLINLNLSLSYLWLITVWMIGE